MKWAMVEFLSLIPEWGLLLIAGRAVNSATMSITLIAGLIMYFTHPGSYAGALRRLRCLKTLPFLHDST
jgi:hypothetical protein